MIFSIAEININLDHVDAHAIVVAAVGYIIVFSALVVLYVVFHSLPKIIKINIRKRFISEGKAIPEDLDQSVSGEVNAAISLALYLHFNDFHDTESNVITIKRASKNYSPWSSKIYSMRHTPH